MLSLMRIPLGEGDIIPLGVPSSLLPRTTPAAASPGTYYTVVSMRLNCIPWCRTVESVIILSDSGCHGIQVLRWVVSSGNSTVQILCSRQIRHASLHEHITVPHTMDWTRFIKSLEMLASFIGTASLLYWSC